MNCKWRDVFGLLVFLGVIPAACGGATTSDSAGDDDDEVEPQDDENDDGASDDRSDDFMPRQPDDDDDEPVDPPKPNPTPDAGAPAPKMDAGVRPMPPFTLLCPQPYEFEMDLQGATAENATLVHHTDDASCGKGSMEVKLDLKPGDKAVITLPTQGMVDLQHKLVWCKYKRSTDNPEVKVWLQAFSDAGKWIEAWEVHPLGKWAPVRKKEVDYPLMTSNLVFWIDLAPKEATFTGSIFLDECGWE